MIKELQISINMKKLFLIITCTLVLFSAKAQDSFDIGVFAGGSFYIGDVNKKQFFYNTQSVVTGVLRYNITNRYAVRMNVGRATIAGSDLDFENQYQQTRTHSFDTELADFNAQFEFYYFDYSPHDDSYNFTPYISAGLGATHYTTNNNLSGFAVNIPFGMGFRFRISKYLSAGAQWEFKKTFSDELDGINENTFREGSLFSQKQKNYFNDNDWVSYIGAFLTITIYKPTGQCNAYGKSYKYR